MSSDNNSGNDNDNVRLVLVSNFDQDRVNRFFQQEYPASKADFLIQHGRWFYREVDEYNYVLVRDDGEIVGHAGGLPLYAMLNGERQYVHWCIDLIVGKAYRARGYYRPLINDLQLIPELGIGFPNEMSRLLLKRSGWRLRWDGLRFSMPLSPTGSAYLMRVEAGLKRSRKARRRSQRIRLRFQRLADKARQLAALGLSGPVMARQRARLERYQPLSARRVMQPDAEQLADVFMRHTKPMPIMTIYRDADYLRWRYLESPFAAEMSYYVAGPADAPTHVLIARTAVFRGLTITRILDLFGALDDQDGLRDVIRLALRDAARARSDLITSTAWLPSVIESIRALDFREVEQLVFAWYSRHGPEMMDKVDHTAYHWVMGDSDADLF
jgi:hypothetical protein